MMVVMMMMMSDDDDDDMSPLFCEVHFVMEFVGRLRLLLVLRSIYFHLVVLQHRL